MLLGVVMAAAACGSSPADPYTSGGGGTPAGPGGSSGDQGNGGSSDPQGGGTPTTGPTCTGDPTAALERGAAQLTKLCARGYTDPISKAFCTATPPTITSLADVLKLLGLDFKQPPPYKLGYTSGQNGNPSFILTAQSSSISTRRVSQLNPRAILFTPPLARGRMTGTPKPNPSYVALGFTRGEQAIELLAKDPTMNGGKGDIRFFLLKYQQACSTTTCAPSDLYTPAVESNFSGWSLYDDEDLKNTVLDCRQCHQPGGPGTPSMLRMQELQRPWTHWMYNDALNIGLLRADFHAAHPSTESYAGIPAGALDFGDVQQLEGFVENNGFQAQPNEFLAATIASEMSATGSSSTWQGLYGASEAGKYIPVPYFDFRATDPTKVQNLITQYNGVVTGKLQPTQLGDMSDIFSDTTMRAMTHKPAQGLSGPQILVQVCQQCHNSHLDQTISRSFFNVEKLGSLSRGEKDEAIRRINLPKDACNHMPPTRFRDLDDSEIALVQAELQK